MFRMVFGRIGSRDSVSQMQIEWRNDKNRDDVKENYFYIVPILHYCKTHCFNPQVPVPDHKLIITGVIKYFNDFYNN